MILPTLRSFIRLNNANAFEKYIYISIRSSLSDRIIFPDPWTTSFPCEKRASVLGRSFEVTRSRNGEKLGSTREKRGLTILLGHPGAPLFVRLTF